MTWGSLARCPGLLVGACLYCTEPRFRAVAAHDCDAAGEGRLQGVAFPSEDGFEPMMNAGTVAFNEGKKTGAMTVERSRVGVPS